MPEGKSEDRLAQLEAKLAEQDKIIGRLQEQNLALMSAPVPAAAAPQIPDVGQEPTLDLTGMPDQTLEGDAYNKELARRLADYNKARDDYHDRLVQANEARIAAQEDADNQASGRTQQLWEIYKEDYPKYAEHESRVRFAAMEATARLQRRGINTDTLMARNPSEFFRAVNESYDKEFGAPTVENNSGEGEGEEERTGGLFGGEQSGGKPGEGGQQQQTTQEESAFSKELKNYQDRMWARPTDAPTT